MKRKKELMLILAIIVTFLATAVFLPGLISAGSLEPSGPPGPTMKTLDEIYGKLETIESKLEHDLALVEETGQRIEYHVGDDGSLRKGVVWPLPRFKDNGNGTVTDNLTGLIWLKDTRPFGTSTWDRACDICAELQSSYLEHLNDGSGAGDWRLPNIKELQSLVHFGCENPALPNTVGGCGGAPDDPFIGLQSSEYWSSTTSAFNSDAAWAVYFRDGSVYLEGKNESNYVWCVRNEYFHRH